MEVIVVTNNTLASTPPSASSSSMALASAGSTSPVRAKSYAESIKLQQAFLDQNCNECEDYNFNGEIEENAGWSSWTPELEQYWTLQYSDPKLFEATNKEVEQELETPSHEAVLIVADDDEGFNNNEIQNSKAPAELGGTFPPKRPKEIKILRQVTFRVCSSTPQPVAVEYDNPIVRAKFTAKILLLKAFQLLVMFGVLLAMCDSSKARRFHQIAAFPVWTASVTYMILLLASKVNLIGSTRMGAGVCIFVQTVCLIEISYAIIANTEPYIILSILIILTVTYLIIASFCQFLSLDVLNSNNLLTLTFCLVFLNTIGSLTFLTTYNGAVSTRPLPAIFGGLFIPICLTCETMVLLTLSELFQILQGNRIPLVCSDVDWVQATAQLY